jgi:transposase
LKAGGSAAKDLTWGVKRYWKCRVTFNRDINACFNIGFVAGTSCSMMGVVVLDISSLVKLKYNQHLQHVQQVNNNLSQ